MQDVVCFDVDKSWWRNLLAQVFWLKDGEVVDVLKEINFIISNEGNLIISQSRLSDMGNYTCGAQNLASRRLSESAYLTVYGLYSLLRIRHCVLCFFAGWLCGWGVRGWWGKQSKGGNETEQADEWVSEYLGKQAEESGWMGAICKRVLLLVFYLPCCNYLPTPLLYSEALNDGLLDESKNPEIANASMELDPWVIGFLPLFYMVAD